MNETESPLPVSAKCVNSTKKHLCLRCNGVFNCKEIDHKLCFRCNAFLNHKEIDHEHGENYVCRSCVRTQHMRNGEKGKRKYLTK